MTTFSVFLPVRNGWPYVKTCVQSVLQQNYPYFELHVLDNQSTDGTVPWLKTQSDRRIHLWSSSTSLSIVDSWARVRDMPKREYMTLVGHDDLLDPHFLAVIKALIDEHPQAALYQTGSRLINAAGRTIRSCRPAPQRESAAEYLTARFTFQRDIFGTGYVMRSADYDRIGGIPAFEKLFFADDVLWLSLMKQSYKAADPRECFAVRVHPKSESASLPSAWSSMLLGLNQFTDFLRNFVAVDAASREVAVRLGASFLLTYHRNIYIFALIEASQRGMRIDAGVLQRIQASLRESAPDVANELRRSAKVRMVEWLHTPLFRSQVSRLWSIYYQFKTRSQ